MKFPKSILSFIGFEYSTHHLQINLSAVPKETQLKVSSGESILIGPDLYETTETLVITSTFDFDESTIMFTEVFESVQKKFLMSDIPVYKNETFPPIEIRIKKNYIRFKIPKNIKPTRTPRHPQSKHGRR